MKHINKTLKATVSAWGSLNKTTGIMLGLILLTLGGLMILGVFDFLLRLVGVLCLILSAAVLFRAFTRNSRVRGADQKGPWYK